MNRYYKSDTHETLYINEPELVAHTKGLDAITESQFDQLKELGWSVK